MNLELSQLALLSVIYLMLLFGIAWLTDQGWIPRKVTSHPLVYVLALGVYASAWAFYGAVDMAHYYGFVFLAYYLGICGAFLLAPVLLAPLLRITRDYQLGSLADLFAFRFRSPWAGTLTTMLMLLAMLPMVAMQIQAVADSVHIIIRQGSPEQLAFGFCIIIILFTIAFGTRRLSEREKHHGLVFALAIQSLVKVIAMLAIGLFILFQVFDGPQGLQEWLGNNREALGTLRVSLDDGPWRTMLLLFFAAAVVMPDMFHITFTENQNPNNLNTASWGLPLYLLLMSLPVPLILWGGLHLQASTTPEYFALGIGLASDTSWLSMLAYAGAMSGASGLIIVTTLALSAMVVNHLVLPVYQPPTSVNIYRWLSWTKRILIAAMILASYGFYRLLDAQQNLVNLAIVAFVASLQFLPGVLSTIYWPLANRKGFIAGLMCGALVWFFTMLIPLITTDNTGLLSGLLIIDLPESSWHWAALVSLSVNIVTLVAVSLTTERSPEELHAAEVCSIQSLSRPSRRTLKASSPKEFQERLSRPLGPYAAQREIFQALKDLDMPPNEHRPYALRRLRDRIESNLSGLMGPSVARDLINRYLPYDYDSSVTSDINFAESQVEEYQHRLTGLAAELDRLRRYHRQTLQNLPMAICCLDNDGEILMWNQAMADLTGIASASTVGSRLVSLASPWLELLTGFAGDQDSPREKRQQTVNGQSRTFNLHKASLEAGLVIMIEDQTDAQLLEQKLMHSERLASIGQLAAGVAHEIGNPVTGIDCLAQELRSYADDEDARDIADQILQQTKRIGKILHSLINFAHSGQASDQSVEDPVSLHRCTHEAAGLLALNKDSRGIRFINNCQETAQVIGDGQKLTQVLINLLSNARDASPDNAVVTVSTTVHEHTVILDVTDQGSGISEEHQKRLFEPFFTTKEAGKGTGLGMALVYSIVEEHFGTIAIRSPVEEGGAGTCISVSLPRYLADLQLQDASVDAEAVEGM